MKINYHKFFGYMYRLESKIAFYPSILSLLGVSFALFMYYIEDLNVSSYLLENAPWLIIKDVETARTILSTFIGGLISIMVFSFSMVMILLNQASSNYSPRVLPGLISNTRHQIVLGIFNSCLLYCIFTLIVIEPTDSKYQLPGFSVLLAIIFMTFSLGAFIYFIHSISQEIQINNIMSGIYKEAKNRLCKLIEIEKGNPSNFPDTESWHAITSKKSGYIENFSLESITEKLNKIDAKAEIVVYKGAYVLKGDTIIKTSEKFEKDINHAIFSDFHFSRSELVEDNYLLAFKHLTEIIVKAMSPGINDPGTAINAIDYLTELFVLRMQKKDSSNYCESDKITISIKSISFEQLLYNVMASIRTYCIHDITIVQKLVNMFRSLLDTTNCVNENYKKVVLQEMENIRLDSVRAIQNKNDLKLLETKMALIEKN